MIKKQIIFILACCSSLAINISASVTPIIKSINLPQSTHIFIIETQISSRCGATLFKYISPAVTSAYCGAFDIIPRTRKNKQLSNINLINFQDLKIGKIIIRYLSFVTDEATMAKICYCYLNTAIKGTSGEIATLAINLEKEKTFWRMDFCLIPSEEHSSLTLNVGSGQLNPFEAEVNLVIDQNKPEL